MQDDKGPRKRAFYLAVIPLEGVGDRASSSGSGLALSRPRNDGCGKIWNRRRYYAIEKDAPRQWRFSFLAASQF
jgi:hypothetical protein